MTSIKSGLGDLAERAASTGWQAAAGYVIAVDVFHDPTLSIPIAAALSVLKSAAVWFYGQHKSEIDKDVAAVTPTVNDLRPVVEAIVADVLSTAAKPTAAEWPLKRTVVLPPLTPADSATASIAATPPVPPAATQEAEKLPPFMQHHAAQ